MIVCAQRAWLRGVSWRIAVWNLPATPGSSFLKTAAANVERHRAGDLRSRGEMALEAVQAGNDDEAVRLIHEIIERQSPYELRDLSGLVSRWHRGAARRAMRCVMAC
jgi:hypothetical protein